MTLPQSPFFDSPEHHVRTESSRRVRVTPLVALVLAYLAVLILVVTIPTGASLMDLFSA